MMVEYVLIVVSQTMPFPASLRRQPALIVNLIRGVAELFPNVVNQIHKGLLCDDFTLR